MKAMGTASPSASAIELRYRERPASAKAPETKTSIIVSISHNDVYWWGRPALVCGQVDCDDYQLGHCSNPRSYARTATSNMNLRISNMIAPLHLSYLPRTVSGVIKRSVSRFPCRSNDADSGWNTAHLYFIDPQAPSSVNTSTPKMRSVPSFLREAKLLHVRCT